MGANKADLISRAAAIDYLMTNMGWRDEDGYEVDDADEKRAIITDLVNGIPAVDAAPVVHGRWIRQKGSASVYKCSACGFVFAGAEIAKYCPNCGALMDGERRDANDAI